MNHSPASCFPRALLSLAITFDLAAAGPAHAPVTLRNPLQDKNFFLLSAIERTPAVRALVRSDPTLAQIGAAKRTALTESPRVCVTDVSCYAKAVRWSDAEIAQSSAALAALGSDAAMSRFVEEVLRQSGMFQRYSEKPVSALLENAWHDAARKMNRAIDIFALGQQPGFPGGGPAPSGQPPGGANRPAQPPAFPGMDLTTYDVKSPAFTRMVQIMAAVVGSDPSSLDLFFEPSLRFAVELLLLHGRDEAARHEPLELGENRAAAARIPSVDWAQFPYSVIVVLGSGPDRAGVALSPIGRLRLTLAVRDFREKKAPFLLVSGGYVHPNLTPYSEAIEMKKALLRDFGIPEDAILVDPQARRTTSNLRNAARLIYRYGIPFERKGLIVTDQLHSSTIETPAFRERCVRDFGYEPVRPFSRISPFALEFFPLLDSLHADASDLLDP